MTAFSCLHHVIYGSNKGEVNNLRKKLIGLFAFVLIAMLALTGCLNQEQETEGSTNDNASAASESEDTITWKYSTTYAEGSLQYERDERFKELVEQLSNGRLELDLHPVGVLADADQLLDSV